MSSFSDKNLHFGVSDDLLTSLAASVLTVVGVAEALETTFSTTVCVFIFLTAGLVLVGMSFRFWATAASLRFWVSAAASLRFWAAAAGLAAFLVAGAGLAAAGVATLARLASCARRACSFAIAVAFVVTFGAVFVAAGTNVACTHKIFCMMLNTDPTTAHITVHLSVCFRR